MTGKPKHADDGKDQLGVTLAVQSLGAEGTVCSNFRMFSSFSEEIQCLLAFTSQTHLSRVPTVLDKSLSISKDLLTLDIS